MGKSANSQKVNIFQRKSKNIKKMKKNFLWRNDPLCLGCNKQKIDYQISQNGLNPLVICQKCGYIIQQIKIIPRLIQKNLKIKSSKKQIIKKNYKSIKVTSIKNNIKQIIQNQFGQNSFSTKYFYSENLNFQLQTNIPKLDSDSVKQILKNRLNQQYLPLNIRQSSIAGKGVFNSQLIQQQHIVCSYIGNIICSTQYFPPSDSLYGLGWIIIGDKYQFLVVDPVLKLNVGRYINSLTQQQYIKDSRLPKNQRKINCRMQMAIVQGQISLFLISQRRIQPQQQILYYYGDSYVFKQFNFKPGYLSQNKKIQINNIKLLYECDKKGCLFKNSNKGIITTHKNRYCPFLKRNIQSLTSRSIQTHYFDWKYLKIYQLQVGKGGFGSVKYGQIVGRLFAVKQVHQKYKQRIDMEIQIYNELNKAKCVGFSKMHGYVKCQSGTSIILDKLGVNLRTRCLGQYTNQNVLDWGLMLLNRYKVLHANGFIHRDLKQQNIVFGQNQNQDILYLIDFGCSSKYIENGQHIKWISYQPVYGHHHFLSITSHKYKPQSRRDDIESLAYFIIQLYCNGLPWTFIDKSEGYLDRIKQLKQEFIKQKYDGLGFKCPQQLWQFLSYSKNLLFDEQPDYELLKQLLISLRKKLNQNKWQQISYDKMIQGAIKKIKIDKLKLKQLNTYKYHMITQSVIQDVRIK